MGFDRSLSYYLFARPSFAEGMARVLDLGGAFDSYNESKTPAEADTRALANDWMMIGQDMQNAIEQYEQAEKTKEVYAE